MAPSRKHPLRDSKVTSPASYEFTVPHLIVSKQDEARYYEEQRKKTKLAMQAKKASSKKHGALSDDQVREVRALLKRNSRSDVALITGISVNTVANIDRGTSYGYVQDEP